MKKFHLFILMAISTITYSQSPISFEKVIKTDSVGKSIIYSSVLEWFAVTYKNSSEVLQMTDIDAGIIVGNGSVGYNHKGLSYLCYEGYIHYKIKIYFKDNRYKVILSNFTHSNLRGNSPSCELGLITDAEKYAIKGMSKKYHNAVWNEIKVKMEDYSNSIFNSLELHTRKISTEKISDDW